MAGAGIVEAIAAVVAVGDAGVVGVIVAAVRKAVLGEGICRLPNTLRRKEANLAFMTIAAVSATATTTAVRKDRAVQVPLRQMPAKTQFFFPVNRSQSIAENHPLLRRPLLSRDHTKRILPRKRLAHVRRVLFRQALLAPLCLAAFPADCRDGSSPKAGPNPRLRFLRMRSAKPNPRRHEPRTNTSTTLQRTV